MTGLIGWWPLHENSGSTARDLSGRGNHGTLKGGVTQGVAGKAGLTANSFDGSDDYISLPSYSASRWTLAAWCRFGSSSGNHEAAVGFGSTDGSGSESRVQLKSQEIETYVDGSSHFAEFSENLNVWIHLAVTQDGKGFSYYLDGQKFDSSNLVAGLGEFENLDIGRTKFKDNVGTKSGYQEGAVSDVRFYSRALSPQEIQAVYKWGDGDYTDREYHDGSDPGALSRWKFNGNVKDLWGSYDGDDNTDLAYTPNAIRNQAKKFDGSGDHILVNSGNDFSQDFSSSGITVSAWVMTSSKGSRKTIWAGNGSDAWWDTRINENEKLEMWYGSSNSNPNIVSSTSLERNKWYHAVFSVRSSDYRIRLYLNGVQDGSGGNGNDPNYKQFSTNSIGERENDEWMDGVIDDLRIYTRSLEPYEVFQLYQWGTRGRDMRKLTVNARGG